jgi:SAM-dependent methyltransferase
MRVKETWRRYSPAQVKDFLRVGYEGREHPSRLRTIELLQGMSSVLDVGCGTGVMFELLRERRPDIDYLGIDVTAQFVAAARERFPADAARFQEGSLYELAKLPGVSDAVLCRHILEHLPDFEPAVQRMYERARRKRDERFERGFYTHTYDLGRFVDHLLNGLTPAPSEVRIHPRQGTSDPSFRWGDRENIIYEVIR